MITHNKVVCILNNEMTNFFSLKSSLIRIGYTNIFSIQSPEEIPDDAEVIIMPGVSAFDTYSKFLHHQNFDAYLKQNNRIKVIGICAGAQILFDSSEEGELQGLGLLSGRVTRLDVSPELKLPHLGWNNIICSDMLSTSFSYPALLNKKFYFSHSYHFPASEDALACTEYGYRFPVIMVRNNKIAIQFHPEKSYNQGLMLLSHCIEHDFT